MDSRNVSIAIDSNGKKIVVINDVLFRGKAKIDWKEIRKYLKQFVGEYYEVEESAERIYIGSKLPEEYTGSESRIKLNKTNSKAKANVAAGIPELIQTAMKPVWEKNRKEKHNVDAQKGWYRYEVNFAIPVYEEETVIRYNVFSARLLVNHASNGKKYLYDVQTIKKETSRSQKNM